MGGVPGGQDEAVAPQPAGVGRVVGHLVLVEQVVIRPEDIDLVERGQGSLAGVVTHVIFKGVHYEMEVKSQNGYEWLVHSTDMFPVGKEVDIKVDPFDIQIMNKPESEDEEAVGVKE